MPLVQALDMVQGALMRASDLLWGYPLMAALIGTGLFLTVRLDFVQFRRLPQALRMVFLPPSDTSHAGEISHFQALMTALAATVGTGNIAGVGTAIALGGPGALVWMWLTGLVGMATKYAEAMLAIRYRVVNPDGTVAGGPMYYIERGLGWRPWALLFALCGAFATFGIGNMVQSNSVALALEGTFHVPTFYTGVGIALFAGFVIIGGIKSIARVSQVMVPVMIVGYVTAGVIAILLNIDAVPGAVMLILSHAFTGNAALGGVVGAGVRESMRYGLARGLFSNESGMGSSPIAAAAARTDHPVTQSLVSMTQTFIDTIVVCSMTGIIIVTAGIQQEGLTGARLTSASFGALIGTGPGGIVVALGLAVFALSTLVGWCYYGEKCVEYLFGKRSIVPYRVLFVAASFCGAVLKLDLVWTFSDVMNALMALPNLVALVFLNREIVRLQKEYFGRPSQAPLD